MTLRKQLFSPVALRNPLNDCVVALDDDDLCKKGGGGREEEDC